MQVFAAVGLSMVSALAPAQKQACPRPAPGSVVTQPEELRSHDGWLKVDLTYTNFTAPNGQEEYCYQAQDGSQAPTLRLRPGDQLILRLKNKLTPSSAGA
jgi:FtsP/CotA-like multicopper oxidase with cupredoxin domain